jgi:hypothetical protein
MRNPIGALLIATSLSSGALVACTNNGTGADMGGSPDLSTTPATPDMGCYAKPTTYLELLNACTNAQAIDKTPVTPLLNADGTLPPLP